MNRETCVYLDAARFSAALVVFLGHVGTRLFGDSLFWQLTNYGAPAVVVFFVLSGFVIGYVSDQKETSARAYAVSRAARLYSVVVPILLLTALLDWIGSRAAPDLYARYDLLLGPGAWHFLASLAFINELWGAHIFPGSDGPYWSLGYEVIYYALFGLGFYGHGTARILGCLLLAAIAGPSILAFFPLWLLGLGAYRACKALWLSPRKGWTMFLGSIAAAAAFDAWSRRYGILSSFHGFFDHDLWGVLQEYGVAVIFAGNLVGFHAISGSFSSATRLVGPVIRWLAGATFTLYLLHLPLLLCVRALVPWPHGSLLYHASIMAIPFGAALAVAQFTERRKEAWHALFLHILPPKAAPGAVG